MDGETVDEVLDYVKYNAKKLVRQLETWVTKSVKLGKISLEEGKEFLNNYRSGLYGYTYLESSVVAAHFFILAAHNSTNAYFL